MIANFANPMQFICSSIQAGSRLGYQESAELCAQYLAPILDAIKFNYLPFGLNQFSTRDDAAQADRLLRDRGCSRRRDTRTPRCPASSRATRCSRTATTSRAGSSHPGMQGVEVQPFTERNMLTPESLAELLGGPDIVRSAGAPPAFGVNDGRLPGPPNAYGENNPLPPPWYPQPGPPPAPAPGVIPGDPLGAIAPAPAAAPAAAPRAGRTAAAR